MTAAIDIAQALGGKRNGRGFLCRCPVPSHGQGHGDRNPSLSIADGDKGLVVNCHAGCDPRAVLEELRRRGPRDKPDQAKAPKPNGEAKVAPPNAPRAKTVRTISYDYRDASGEVCYRKERFERDDGTKFFCFYQPDGTKGLGGTRHLLYGGERLADLSEGQSVWIVEGERKADRLRALGAVAVSGDTGYRSKWLPAHVELLRGLPVVLWPDSDSPGERYIANAAEAILAGDPGADIRVVRPLGPPDGAKGKDVCDWHGDEAALAELAARATPYAPLALGKGDAGRFLPSPDYDLPGLPAPNPITLLSYDEMVGLPSADWLIEGLVPRRSKSVLFGQSDSFKSFLAVDMAASVSTGRSYHGKPVKQCKAIYIANEGAIGVGRKRIPAWMAAYEIQIEDRQNIFLVKAETILPDEASRANLVKAIRTIVEPGEDFLLIVDVLRGTMTGSESDDEAAHAWTRAAEFLVDEGATLLTVTHSPYSTDDRIRGSSHLWGSFDTRLQAEGDKENMTAVLKVNRHKDSDSRGEFGFKLEVVDIPEHRGETSLVPRLDGEVKASKRNANGKDGTGTGGETITRQYLETYDRLAGAAEEKRRETSGEKTLGLDFKPVIKVSTDTIRDDLKSRGLLDKNGKGGLTGAARTACYKAKRVLIVAGKLIEQEDCIWRP